MAETSEPISLKRAPNWEPEHVLVFEARNLADYMVNLNVTFEGGDKEVSVRIGIFPGWPTRIALPLEIASGRTLFLERTPGRFKAVVRGANLSFEALETICIQTAEGAENDVAFGDAWIAEEMPDEYPMPDEPLVDGLHQWRHREWPGKAESLEQVRQALEAEEGEPEPAYPQNWSQYGGWRQKRFNATGFFRAEHDGKRWWLVDPEGHAFWSIGVDCLRHNNGANVTGIESVFDPPLPSRESHSHLWSVGRTVNFDAMVHNLERALGSEWRSRWLELTRRRLLKYRFNTIANWSERALHPYCKIPYVFTMGSYPSTGTMIFRDFPDVFAPEFEANARKFARQLESIREDPYVIGYFMTNEPKWAFVQGFDLGWQILLTDEPSASRDALIQALEERYVEISRLNAVWGTEFGSFEALRRKQRPERFPACKADTLAFTARAVERFVTLPAQACREVDPNHLNLGLRWAWIHSDYQLVGHEHLDAFSINCYQLKPDPAMIERIVEKTGKPMMIGEFHIGSIDRGLPSGGIRNTLTMDESVKAYRYYVENAAAIPGLIGAHYFQWNDQHIMGRGDGENMQIGLHDITYRAYPEWVAMCQRAHPGLYEVAAGRREPTAEAPRTVPQGTLCW